MPIFGQNGFFRRIGRIINRVVNRIRGNGNQQVVNVNMNNVQPNQHLGNGGNHVQPDRNDTAQANDEIFQIIQGNSVQGNNEILSSSPDENDLADQFNSDHMFDSVSVDKHRMGGESGSASPGASSSITSNEILNENSRAAQQLNHDRMLTSTNTNTSMRRMVSGSESASLGTSGSNASSKLPSRSRASSHSRSSSRSRSSSKNNDGPNIGGH